jgi:hypothetical protein
MVNFADALNTKTGSIERPPLIPVGTYTAIVSKPPSMETISDGKWDVLDFQLRLQQPQEDVDQEALGEYGGLGPQSVLRHRFMFSKDDEAAFKRTLFNLKRFLQDHLKIDGNDDTPLKQMIDGSVNMQCLVYVKWRADKNDTELFYNEVGKTAPIE